MKYKITFILLFWALYFSFGQAIYSNEINDNNPADFSPYSNGEIINLNITGTGISRGPGITGVTNPLVPNSYAAYGWRTIFALDDYFEITISPNSGYQIDFSNFTHVGSTTSINGNLPPSLIAIRSSLDGFSTNIGTPLINGSTIDLSSGTYQNVTTAVTFRIYAWGRTEEGVFGIDSFEFNGSVDPIPCSGAILTTWSNGNWDNGTPDQSTTAVLNDHYNTQTNGSFSACSLVVNNTLTVTNNEFIEVENDITVNGTLTISSKGAVVQNDENSEFIDNSSNNVTVTKSKTLHSWYTYTYWSTPVSNTTIENALGTTPQNRRFAFNAANFVDVLSEINNTNTFEAGSDDIDDDGNDWVYASGAMLPGVGYAATAQEFVGPGGYPQTENYIFTGALNNAEILVPLINNSNGAYNDWNFIGNPYPSAIDVDAFFAINTGLVDVIYLWDQATTPSNTNSGNENINFSNDDYAIINGTGSVQGARVDSGTPPNRYIPSGQGFFVEALAAGNATFNNAMRVTSNNTQFFRSKKKKPENVNRLWLNLTSDNGGFNQILIGYIDGATKNKDATFYDTPKNLSTNAPVMLFSNIEGETKKFAIQGKAVNDLSQHEVITIGIKTTIDIPTIYTLSIAQIEGEFLNNNVVYLKDNLLNTFHNLKVNDYNFTSEMGEFNNRFEIVFKENALINNSLINKNALTIIEHNNGSLQFKLYGNNSISNIKIIDLHGRLLYNYDSNMRSKDEILTLSNLSQAAYIAKVTLDNNYVITKKSIKKY